MKVLREGRIPVAKAVKRRAHRSVRSAIAKGVLKARPCEGCLRKTSNAWNPAIHAHHVEYSEPLLVRWLCVKCHARAHMNGGPPSMTENAQYLAGRNLVLVPCVDFGAWVREPGQTVAYLVPWNLLYSSAEGTLRVAPNQLEANKHRSPNERHDAIKAEFTAETFGVPIEKAVEMVAEHVAEHGR